MGAKTMIRLAWNKTISFIKFKKFKNIFLFILISPLSIFITQKSQAENIIKIEVVRSIFGSGEILTDCKIGTKNQRCKIDTGAPYSLSSNDDLNLESSLINKIQYYGISGSIENCNFVETNENLSLDKLSFKSRALLICPSNKDKGLLGLNHLTEAPLLFNLKKQIMVINPEVTPENLHSYISDSNDHIFIKIKIYKAKVEHELIAMLDTGAGITLANKDLINTHPEFLTLLSSNATTVSDTNKVEIETQLGLMNGIQISNKKIIIPYVMFTDFNTLKKQTGLDVDMILGINVLNELNQIYIDPINKSWSVN
jgi:hypothetical protein